MALKEWKEASASGLNLAAANQKGKSLLYIMLGHEGQKRFKQRLPHVQITDLHFGDLWRHLDDVFLIARNITVERVTLFSRMHESKESIEQFHSALTGLAAECEFGALEQQIVRDLFVTRVNAPELQRKFCVELTSPDEVLRQALAWERGVNNQKKLVKFTLGKGDPDLAIGTSDGAKTPNPTPAVKTEPIAPVRSQPRTNNTQRTSPTNAPCRNCGRDFRPGYAAQCPARGVQCRACGKRNHFARMCRTNPPSQLPQPSTPRTSASNPGPDKQAPRNPPSGSQATYSKKTRFIEQTHDEDSTLDNAYSRVGAIISDEPEDGAICDSHVRNMYKTIQATAKQCFQCTSTGKNLACPSYLTNSSPRAPATRVLDELEMDFLGPIYANPPSSQYVLVTVDRFSRFPFAMCCSSPSAESVLKFLS